MKHSEAAARKLHMLLAFLLTAAVMLGISPAAYALTGALQCGLDEHSHGPACWQTVPDCEYAVGDEPEAEAAEAAPERQEDDAGHRHGPDCYASHEELICTDEGHEHGESCYETVIRLVCGEHEHTDGCYVKKLICTMPEHEHSRSCYFATMDGVETEADWEATVPEELSGDWREDFLSVARSQIGYYSNESNRILAEDGKTWLPYSRYGHWYGFPYGQWCVMFVSFCACYADIPRQAIPYESGCQAMVSKLAEMGVYESRDYVPQPGDMVFISYDGGQTPSHVGIVSEYSPGRIVDGVYENASLVDIEGNNNSTVCERKRWLTDDDIFGYMNMQKVIDRWFGAQRIAVDCGGTKLYLEYPGSTELNADLVRAKTLAAESEEYAALSAQLAGYSGDGTVMFYRIDAELEGSRVQLPVPDTLKLGEGIDGGRFSAGLLTLDGELYVYIRTVVK